jgi:hypothetical protein
MFGRTQKRDIERWNQERLLFRYWDGTRARAIDPFRVYREIRSDKTVDLESIGPQVDAWEEPATGLMLDMICRVFGVKRYDDATGEGLTDPELLNLFGDVNDYLDWVKKKHNPGPTLPPSTA